MAEAKDEGCVVVSHNERSEVVMEVTATDRHRIRDWMALTPEQARKLAKALVKYADLVEMEGIWAK